MLYKAHNESFLEDFGLVVDDKYIHFMDAGIVKLSNIKAHISPVVRVKAMWMDKDIKINCEVADTMDKKIRGLQKHSRLEMDCGMYFPYEPYSDVVFHQGKVPFSLDLIFLKDGCIEKIESNTRVGHDDKWSCEGVDGVIEVTGGYCEKNGVVVEDEVVLFAVSERDLIEVQEENRKISLLGAIIERL